MATVIKIKNTNLDKAPVDGLGDSLLATGELAYSYFSGAQNNDGDRLYVGVGTETNGLSSGVQVIGGKYFTDMLDHVHGTLTASSGVIVDANKKIDEWRVDNLVLDGNTLSVDQTSNANGNINIIPGGTTGEVIVSANKTTINGDFVVSGTQTFTGNLDVTGTGHITGTLDVDSEVTAASLIVEDLTDNRIVIAGAGGQIEDDANFTFNGTTFDIGQGDFVVTVATGNTAIAGTLDVNGQSTLASLNVEDLTDNRIVIAGASGEIEDDSNFTFDGTTFKVGTDTTDKFRVAVASGNVATTGTLDVDGAVNLNATLDVDGQSTLASLNVEDLTATRIVFAGANGELVDDANFTFDAVNDKLTVVGEAQIDNLKFNGNDLATSTGALTITPAANAETIINTTSAIRVPVGNSTERPSTNATGQIRYNTTTNQYEGYSSGAWQGLGGVIDVDQNTYIIAQPTSNLSVPAGQVDDTLYFVTGGAFQGKIDTASGWTLNNVNIDDNTISTTTGDLYLDPGQTGESSPTGNVVIYGNLNVMGTTTTIDSTTVTVDDPIFTLGGDTAPTADDNKDRGIEFRWHDGISAKTGFFGYDDSAERFKFIADATNTSEVFAGAASDVEFGNALIDSLTFSATNFTANSVPWVNGDGDVGFLEEVSSPYGTEGQVVQMNASGVPVFGHIDCGTY
jgi:hypothetical protein